MTADSVTELRTLDRLLATSFSRPTVCATSSQFPPMACSLPFPRAHPNGRNHLAAIVSSLASVARTASRRYSFDSLKLIMIEMHRGMLLVSSMDGGNVLSVVADSTADLNLIGRESSMLADQFGSMLTPALIE